MEGRNRLPNRNHAVTMKDPASALVSTSTRSAAANLSAPGRQRDRAAGHEAAVRRAAGWFGYHGA
jgi:hypothetical protein